MPMTNKLTESVGWIKALLASLEMGIVILDKDYKVEVWNQFMENHSKIDAKDIAGKPLFSLFPDIQEAWFKNKCKPVFALATPVFMIWEQRKYLFKFEASRPVTSDTDFMYQNITITPLLNDSGEVDKLCILVYDATDQALNKLRVDGLNNKLETISRVDGLTGLYNRRYWQERFDREYKLSVRNKSCNTLMMLDIDHFKKVNDTYGHQAGDAVIRNIADVIKSATRETDIAGRYGGEEFAILLPDTEAKNAVTVAERIRKVVKATQVEYAGQVIQYTCSLGVAQQVPEYTKPNQWIEIADQALYKAKDTGRNKVVVL